MYAGRHLAEIVQFLPGAEADDGVVGIGWLQADTALVAAVGLHGEVAIHARDDHVAVGGAEGAVHDQQVAVAGTWQPDALPEVHSGQAAAPDIVRLATETPPPPIRIFLL